ncbi:hypothetical protein DMC30DRAFT_350148 [Rhodotorula diobovata]|uniref:Uncharacterized protein n=1 Tax=Rhodotorula diobovata TaxID=5288 RepID=A0A5C5FZH2_9BASI|nr:hypothetical protein DMC30DRAFT_350148 [Rhodotorula diobovata]
MAHSAPTPAPLGPAPSLVVLAPTSAFLFGFTSGLVSSSKLAAKQFLAENAHRLPTTVQGWYFYQKTKNYRVLWAGIKGGLRTGARLALWTGAFLSLEESVDAGIRSAVSLARPTPTEEQRDVLRTKWAAGAVAGAGMAGAASWWCASLSLSHSPPFPPPSAPLTRPHPPAADRLSRPTVPRRLALGLALGGVAGGAVDLRDWLRARLPGKDA